MVIDVTTQLLADLESFFARAADEVSGWESTTAGDLTATRQRLEHEDRACAMLELELGLDERPAVLDLHDSPVIVGPLAHGAPVRPPWNDLAVLDLTTP